MKLSLLTLLTVVGCAGCAAPGTLLEKSAIEEQAEALKAQVIELQADAQAKEIAAQQAQAVADTLAADLEHAEEAKRQSALLAQRDAQRARQEANALLQYKADKEAEMKELGDRLTAVDAKSTEERKTSASTLFFWAMGLLLGAPGAEVAAGGGLKAVSTILSRGKGTAA